jgi:hypothetical protein
MSNCKKAKEKLGLLVLGSYEFIERNFVEYSIENELVSYLRVLDKKFHFRLLG